MVFWTKIADMQLVPTIRPHYGFNAQQDADAIFKALKGGAGDKTKLVQLLVSRSNAQRQDIAHAYKQLHGKDLKKELKDELSGELELLCLALVELPAYYDASELHKAMAGLGTKEHVLIEIITTRTNAQIRQIKQAYKELFKTDLEKDIVGDTSGSFQNILVSLVNEARDEGSYVDGRKAFEDAKKLHTKKGLDREVLNTLLATQNGQQLRQTFTEYQKISSITVDRAIANEFSGDDRDIYEAVIKGQRNKQLLFAEFLYNAMKGSGTRDQDLIRLLVSRSEIDLANIRTEYVRNFGKALDAAVASECTKQYKEGLVALVKGNY